MTRKEGEEYNTKAGLDFAQKIRKMQYVGPILIFCGNVDKAKQEMAQEHLVTITNETAVAQNYACFQQRTVTTLYPDFAQLRKEGIEFKDVVSDDTGKVAYTKYYITPTMYSADDTKEASRIFFQVEELLFRYVDPALISSVKRVIVIDSPSLRDRFDKALQRMEAEEMGPWDTDPLLNNLLRAIPNTPFRKARPTLMWHCTGDLSEVNICSNGYSLKKLGAATKNMGWYGAGLYFTSVPTYATHYAHQRSATYAAADICITLNWVLVGRPALMTQVQEGRDLEPGYTSHYAVTNECHPIQKYADDQGGFTKKVDGDELVVYDESFALPQFLVELQPEVPRAFADRVVPPVSTTVGVA